MRPRDLPLTKVWTAEEWAERMAQGGPPTADDVSITMDGRRLDTPAKVIAFVDELKQAAAATQAERPAAGRGS
jgi:chaperone required for assembly of F1-ATPase